jgi:hypothetical protein
VILGSPLFLRFILLGSGVHSFIMADSEAATECSEDEAATDSSEDEAATDSSEDEDQVNICLSKLAHLGDKLNP